MGKMGEKLMVSAVRSWWAVTVVAIVLLGSTVPSWADDVVWPKVRAKGLLLVDLSQQQVLFESNASKRLAPASLTKVMTALIAFEEGDLNATVTISRHAAHASLLGMRPVNQDKSLFPSGRLIRSLLDLA